jgi:hypothetical protein
LIGFEKICLLGRARKLKKLIHFLSLKTSLLSKWSRLLD